MRKKLLALLMCATMVLGTGVTAFADTASDAAKIGGENANNFMSEYWKGDAQIVKDAYTTGGKTVKYGFLDTAVDTANKYTPVVVYKSGDDYYPAQQITGSYNAFEVDTAKATANEIDGATFAEQKAQLEAIYGEAAVATMNDGSKFYTIDNDEMKKVETLSDTSVIATKTKNDKYVAVTTLDNSKVGTTEAAIVADKPAIDNALKLAKVKTSKDADQYVAVTVYNANGTTSTFLVKIAKKDSAAVVTADELSIVAPTSYVSNTNNYVQSKSVDFKTDKLVKGNTKLLKANDVNFGTVYTKMEAASADTTTLVDAIETKQISKDAVSVKVSAMVLGGYASETLGATGLKCLPLYNATKLVGGTYTFDTDLLSRTAFAGAEAVNVFVQSPFETKYSEVIGSTIKALNPVATVKADGTFVFDKTADFTDGIFVFDKGELAEEPTTENNDGVSDAATTAAAADAPKTSGDASPKTGDVAPIAALAVVMMGACGAMVVASKKRA